MSCEHFAMMLNINISLLFFLFPTICYFFFFILAAGSDHPPPVIRQGSINQTVPVDSTVVLGCQTAGTPPPTVQWKKDGVVVSPVDSRMSISDTGSLEIRYTKVGDEVIQQLVLTALSQASPLMSAIICPPPQPPSAGRHRLLHLFSF